MSETLMTLGPIDSGLRFSLDTAAYQELTRSNSWDWQEQTQIGSQPNIQYTGKSAEKVTLRGSIYPHFRGGLEQIDGMRAQADKAVPLLMTDGTGKVWGEYVIESITETQRLFWGNGAPRVQTFSMSLKKYAN